MGLRTGDEDLLADAADGGRVDCLRCRLALHPAAQQALLPCSFLQPLLDCHPDPAAGCCHVGL